MKNSQVADSIRTFGKKIGFTLILSLMIGYTVVLSSIQRFWDTDFTSAAATNGLIVSGIVPCVLFILVGPFILDRPKVRVLTQIAAALVALIGVYYAIFDYLGYTEWIGSPAMMNLGYYWTYALYPPIIVFSALFTLMITAAFDIIARKGNNERENYTRATNGMKQDSNRVLIFLLIIVLVAWLIVYQFLRNGYYSTLLIFCIAISFHLFVKILDSLKVFRRSTRDTPNEENQSTSKNNGEVIKNGIRTVFESLFGWLPFFGLIFANAGVISTFIVRPNVIPLYTEFFPLLLVAGLIIGFIYKISGSRYLLILLSTGLTLLVGLIIVTNKFAFVEHRDLLLWLLALSMMGSLASFSLYLRNMVKGKFSRVFWGVIGIFMSFAAHFFGSTIKWDIYDDTIYYGTAPIAIICLVIIFIGRLIAENRIEINNSSSHVEKENNRHGQAHIAQSCKWKEAVLMTLILGGLFIAPAISISREGRIETEHVLASSNGDYYVWAAENTRTIDKYYEPSLLRSQVNPVYRLTGARGEHQGFQMIFSPGKIKNHNLRSIEPLHDLKKESTDATIGKGNISVYAISYVEQLNDQFPDQFREFTRLDTGLNLDGQQNYPFYVDVAIPRDDDIEPGVYNTTMQVYCRDYHDPFPGDDHQYNNRIIQFDLQVEVYNFTISLERHINMEIIWGIQDNDAWEEFYGDYRLDPYWPRAPVAGYNATAGGLEIAFDFTRWLDDLQYGFNQGMSYYPITWIPPGLNWSLDALDYSDEFETLLTWYIGNITEQLAGKTTPWGTNYLDHAYFFIRDEPQPAYYDLITSVAQLIHSVNSSVKIMETMNQELSTYPDDFLEEVDHYCMHIHEWHPSQAYPDDDTVDKWPTRLKTFLDTYSGPREKSLWIYHTHNRFPTPDTDIYMSGMLQRSMLWLHWIYNVDTYLYWSFNWATDMSEGYGYASYGESNLVGFGEDDEPLSSLRLERIRDGIEDYEYFWILNDTCTQLENGGYSAESVTGRNLLEQVSQTFNQPEYWSHMPNYESDDFEGFKWSYSPYAEDYLTLRDAIGEEITRIHSLSLL